MQSSKSSKCSCMYSYVIQISLVYTRMSRICGFTMNQKTPLNEVQLSDMMGKWSKTRMAKPKVQNLWNDLCESYSLSIFHTYSAIKMINCPSINFCFEFLESRRIFWSLVEDPKAWNVQRVDVFLMQDKKCIKLTT